jgi:uncharacterized protein YeaO (DUF488 family)
MSVKIVQLGSDRIEGEGIRIGTVRRPPRGVPKEEFASRNYYDVWFPNLAPSTETMKIGKDAETCQDWNTFVRAYKKEMKHPSAQHDLRLLAKLSHTTNFSVGCYCEDEANCHRSILRKLLLEHGALVE